MFNIKEESTVEEFNMSSNAARILTHSPDGYFSGASAGYNGENVFLFGGGVWRGCEIQKLNPATNEFDI